MVIIFKRIFYEKEGVELTDCDCDLLIESVDEAVAKVLIALGLSDSVTVEPSE